MATRITQNLGSRNKPVSPVLTDAVSRVIEQTYGPGYYAVMRSGAGASVTGTKRHTPGRGGQLGVAADFQIFAPDNHQLAGAELDPLLKNWVGIEGSMGANRYPGNKGRNFTHMDLIGGIQPYSVPLGRKEDVFWTYDGLDPKSTFNESQQKQMVASGEIHPVAAPQNAQSAIASLLPPQGGTLAPNVPAGAEAFAPFLPPPSPGQAAISDLISPPSTVSDRDKLAGVMLAEARGEGRNGMAGVGNVVLNRQAAEGNRFPKTINEVINNEFAKPLGPNDVSPDEWAEATQTATQLLDGTIPDNTGGAVYFANTATSKPSLYAEIANSGPVSATIGNHTFHTDAKIGAVARGTGDLTADQIDELTRTDVAGNYTNPLVAPPPVRRPGPGGALGVDLGQQPAGMPPPPSRPGTFDWLGGGAPPAAMVPPPGISPLRPAFGGPGDRRPQPPTPPSRPMGMPPSGPQSPVGAFSPQAGPLDLVPFLPPPPASAAPAIAPPLERANRRIIAGGQGGPVIPISPAEMRSTLANAGANTEMSLGLGGLGTPETQMSLARTYPPPLSGIDERMDRAFSEAQSRGLARELGFNRRQMEGYTRPPPSAAMMANMSGRPATTPDFDFAAGSGPTFTPPALNPRISGGGGSDALAAGNASPPLSPPPPALMPSGDPWAKAYGQRPDLAAQLGINNIATAAPEASPASWATGMDQYRPMLPLPPIPGTRFLPPDADPNNITLPTEPLKITSPVQDADVANQTVTVPPPLTTAANAGVDAPSQAKTPESQKRRSSSSSPSLLARIGNALVPGSPFGPGGGGVGGFGFGIGPGGFFANAGNFTPSGAGGTSFFNMQPNGAMGTTNWRQGSVTGNPAMSGVMWNRSGDNGSVGYVTNPFNDSLIYSGSPNRF